MKQGSLYIVQIVIAASVVFSTAHSAFSQRGIPGEDQPEIVLTSKFINAQRERLLGNFSEAERLLADCIQLDDKNDAVYYELGKTYRDQNRLQEAIPQFEKAANLDKENEWYWLTWAQTLVEQEDFKAAATVYEKIKDKHPDDPSYLIDYANALMYSGKAKKAMKVYNELEDRAGISPEVSMRKYRFYITNNQYNEAAEELEKLISSAPADNQLYGMLADLYKAQGKVDKALDVYERAGKADPQNPYLQLSLAEYYERNNERDSAFRYLKKAYSNANLDIDTKVGVLLRMYNDAIQHPLVREEALVLCEHLVDAHPNDAKSHSVHGDYLTIDKQLEQAIISYKKAVAIDPSRYPIWNQLLYLESETMDYEGLVEDSKSAIEYFPAQPTLYLLNGIGNAELEQYNPAAKSLKTGATLVLGNSPLSAQMLASLGDAYHEMGRHQSSDSAFDASLSYAPENTYVLNNYSYFLSLRNTNLEKALEMSGKTLEKEPNNVSYLDTYGWILFQLGKYDDAKSYLGQALENGGNKSAEVLEHYGDTLFKLGEKEEALAHWKLASELASDNEALNNKISTGVLE